MSTSVDHRPAPPGAFSFYIGAARWRTSLRAVVDPLIHTIESAPDDIVPLVSRPYSATRHVSRGWMQHLHTAQDSRCFWCGRSLPMSQATVEHVLPFSGRWWPRLSRMEQLLSLRLSHAHCNRAYATWRQAEDPHRVVRMDRILVRVIDQVMETHAFLQLYDYHHYHPARRTAML